MFTSRAEFRTLLRQDNADLRLTEIGYNLGLAKKIRLDNLNRKKEGVEKVKAILNLFTIEPEKINDFLISVYSSPLSTKQKAAQVLLRPGISLIPMMNAVTEIKNELNSFETDVLEQAEIQIKYETYIEKEKELVQKMSQLENLIIPDSFNYDKLTSLSNEARQKFTKIQPKTLGQASRISGVNPSDIQILMLYMGR
jgi:tRNA uridine 5-carboxymethylaminomethyl modification enzyme